MRFGIFEKREKWLNILSRLEDVLLCFSNSASKMGQKRFLNEKVSQGPIGRYDPQGHFFKKIHFFGHF